MVSPSSLASFLVDSVLVSRCVSEQIAVLPAEAVPRNCVVTTLVAPDVHEHQPIKPQLKECSRRPDCVGWVPMVNITRPRRMSHGAYTRRFKLIASPGEKPADNEIESRNRRLGRRHSIYTRGYGTGHKSGR